MFNNTHIAAVVVLYHPDYSVYQNIQTYISYVDKLYIVDNSENESPLTKKLSTYPKSTVLHRGKNIGIAQALNLALIEAKKDNYDWLMTMDQDSFFQSGQLKKYIKDCCHQAYSKVALFSPQHNAKFAIKDGDNVFSKQLTVMTSANIINVDKILAIGSYDENLFIDEVDHELGLRLNQMGLEILRNDTVYVSHSLGILYSEKYHIRVYPPIRIYYMIRNYLYLKNKYRNSFSNFFNKRDRYLVKFFFLQLFFNGKPFETFQMFFRGVWDYKKKKFGAKDA